MSTLIPSVSCVKKYKKFYHKNQDFLYHILKGISSMSPCHRKPESLTCPGSDWPSRLSKIALHLCFVRTLYVQTSTSYCCFYCICNSFCVRLSYKTFSLISCMSLATSFPNTSHPARLFLANISSRGAGVLFSSIL